LYTHWLCYTHYPRETKERGSGVTQNVFDSGAWYLLAYTNTMSFSEWRAACKQTYVDLEGRFGVGAAKDNLAKMIAYYCMEVAPGPSGRKAISQFRKVHSWSDFREGDCWWLDEWKTRRAFDLEVARVRSGCIRIPSIDPSEIQNEYNGRAALDVLISEQMRRYEWERHRYSKDNLSTMEACWRVTISMFGGSGILDLHQRDLLKDKIRIPNLQTSYWVERVLVEEYGEKLITAKEREAADAIIRQ
jgi:hypothetical protein